MGDVSSLQLLVPEAQELLEAVRGLPGVALLEPAHVSLGYPWRPAGQARTRLEQVRAAAAAVPAAEVTLHGPHRFAPDARGRVLVHARLPDDGAVRALAGALGADLRDAHLSLARVAAGADVDAVERLLAPLLPRPVRLAQLELTVQDAGRWSRLLLAPLASP